MKMMEPKKTATRTIVAALHEPVRQHIPITVLFKNVSPVHVALSLLPFHFPFHVRRRHRMNLELSPVVHLRLFYFSLMK